MDKDQIPHASQADDTPADGAQIAGLIGDVRSLADSEWEYAKARLSYSGGIMRKAGLLAMLAIFALSGAVIALILGILLIVASYFGPWIATITVVFAFGITAYFLAIAARKTARNLSFAEGDGDER